MVCPTTNRRVTVLYLKRTGTFAHRLAFPQDQLYYNAQLDNKQFRGLSNCYGLDGKWAAQ